MKYARNTFLALVLLVLVYGSCYRLFYREAMFTALRSDELVCFPSPPTPWQKLFAPAVKFDLYVSLECPERKRLRGHWINAETGDFVTISENNKCNFRLGEFEYAGKVTLEPLSGSYYAEFRHGEGDNCYFHFSGDKPVGSKEPHSLSYASVDRISEDLFDPHFYSTDLTESPD